MSRPHKPPDPVELSIGTLSSATGVPVDTLRAWERRYGFPAPSTRTGGSHRRYAADTIEQVRLIVRALEHGHRPSAVVGRDPEELVRLIGAPPSIGAARPSGHDASAGAAAWAHTPSEEIGQHFGVSRVRVRQIEVRAQKKLERQAQREQLDTGCWAA
jgi:hypothetical protein